MVSAVDIILDLYTIFSVWIVLHATKAWDTLFQKMHGSLPYGLNMYIIQIYPELHYLLLLKAAMVAFSTVPKLIPPHRTQTFPAS